MNLGLWIKNTYRDRQSALRIAGIYVLIGVIWVFVTDHLIGMFTNDIETFVEYEIIKAWMYVLITGMLLYHLVLREFRKISRLNEEYQQAIKTLQESEKKNSTLLSLIPDMIYRIDREGIFLDSNPSGQKNVFLSSGNVIGKKINDVLPPHIAGDTMRYVEKALKTNVLQIHEFNLTTGNETRYYEARILANEPDEVAVTVRDFTEKKKNEELTHVQQRQLMQADKMATLGIMVSGVAHEINNPNNYILLNGKIISRVWQNVLPILEEYYQQHGDFELAGMPYSRAHERIGKLIEGIPEGAHRIQEIVKTFKDFARQDSGKLNQQVDINKGLESAIIILNNLIKKSTDHFIVNYGQHLPAITGNQQQIEQVMINLITNSCQALRDKDHIIHITTSFSEVQNEIVLIVHDEGVGIPEDNIKYIFDPFYTTKPDSGGTGLGLIIAYKIIENHGGNITITSTPGQGTTARVTIPALPS